MILPNFLIIGAAKAGTTSLHEYLGEHPDIYMSHPIKEVNYFAYGDPVIHKDWPDHEFFVTRWDDYLAQFKEVDGEKIVGESSPIYLESPKAVITIHQQLPEVKLLASLRNPAERAFSGYLMHVRNATESRLISNAFTDINVKYIQGGFYFEKIKRYVDLYGYEQLYFVLFDDIKRDMQSVMQGIFTFLEVDTAFVPDLNKKHNVGTVPKNHSINTLLMNPFLRNTLAPLFPKQLRQYGKKLIVMNRTEAPKLDEETRMKLTAIYRDDILRLQDLIRRDLSVWL